MSLNETKFITQIFPKKIEMSSTWTRNRVYFWSDQLHSNTVIMGSNSSRSLNHINYGHWSVYGSSQAFFCFSPFRVLVRFTLTLHICNHGIVLRHRETLSSFIIFLSKKPEWINQCSNGLWLHGRGSIPGRLKIFFSSPQCPDRLWGPSNLILNGYRGRISRE
jgi:hypothetical protein